MASFLVGKYVYDSNENLANFYKDLKVPTPVIEKLVPAQGAIKEFLIDGNKIIFSGEKSVTFILDTEVEGIEHNFTFKSTAKLDGNRLLVNSRIVENDKMLYRIFQTNAEGLMITLKSDETNIEAKVYFKRL